MDGKTGPDKLLATVLLDEKGERVIRTNVVRGGASAVLGVTRIVESDWGTLVLQLGDLFRCDVRIEFSATKTGSTMKIMEVPARFVPGSKWAN
jgi:hypothetical protein